MNIAVTVPRVITACDELADMKRELAKLSAEIDDVTYQLRKNSVFYYSLVRLREAQGLIDENRYKVLVLEQALNDIAMQYYSIETGIDDQMESSPPGLLASSSGVVDVSDTLDMLMELTGEV